MQFPLLPLLLVTAALSTPLSAQLPPSIGQVTNPANGHIYHILDESTWTDAQDAALALGGHLATIDDQAENDWVFNTFGQWGGQSRDLWIGLNDVNSEGTFVWASGTGVGYTNWTSGQPDNYLGNDPINGEDHVHIYGFNSVYGPGQWNDMHDALPGSASWTFGLYGVVELDGPVYSISNLVAGGTATLSVTNATAGGPIILGFSRAGAGPVQTPYGLVELSFPITQLPPVYANASGVMTIDLGVPANSTGMTLYSQGVDLTSGLLTNALAEVIQ